MQYARAAARDGATAGGLYAAGNAAHPAASIASFSAAGMATSEL
jgi:hypothetical protein